MEIDSSLNQGERFLAYARDDRILSMNSWYGEKDSSLALGMTGFSLVIREKEESQHSLTNPV